MIDRNAPFGPFGSRIRPHQPLIDHAGGNAPNVNSQAFLRIVLFELLSLIRMAQKGGDLPFRIYPAREALVS